MRCHLSRDPNNSVRRVGSCSGLNVNDGTAFCAPVRFPTSCDVCDESAPLISSSFCAVHGFLSDHVPCHVTKLIFLSFRARCSTFLGLSVGQSGKVFSPVRKASVTQCEDQSVRTSEKIGDEHKVLELCRSSVVLWLGSDRSRKDVETLLFCPTPDSPLSPTTASHTVIFSVPPLGPLLPFDPFRLLSTFHLCPLSSTTTHLLSHPSNQLPTLHPNPSHTSHATQSKPRTVHR